MSATNLALLLTSAAFVTNTKPAMGASTSNLSYQRNQLSLEGLLRGNYLQNFRSWRQDKFSGTPPIARRTCFLPSGQNQDSWPQSIGNAQNLLLAWPFQRHHLQLAHRHSLSLRHYKFLNLHLQTLLLNWLRERQSCPTGTICAARILDFFDSACRR